MDDEKIYVSKGEVVLALLEKGQHSKRYKLGETWELNFFEIQEAIDDMPTADVQPVKHGEWKFYKNNGIYDTYKCSICKESFELSMDADISQEIRYCPNCGAKMDVIFEDDKVRAIKVV